MNTLETTDNRTMPTRVSWPRRMLDFACVAMANYTTSGPGSLAPAQPTVTRREMAQIEVGSCDRGEPTRRSRSTFSKVAMPLRRVFDN